MGIVIPTLNEAETLPGLFSDLRKLALSIQVVVADGGSTDETLTIARDAGALICSAPTGRSRQMNAGAWLLRTKWLMFLHADSRLPLKAREALGQHVERSNTPAHFRLRFSGEGSALRLVEAGQRLRQRLLKLVYGDQGLVLPKEVFDQLSGFPDVALMEDVIMTRRLQRRGSLLQLAAPLLTSPRRYEKEGLCFSILRNSLLLGRFALGASPDDLARQYPPHNPLNSNRQTGGAESGKSAGSQAVLVFAKAPVAGKVKTRLAVDLGVERATAAYRIFGKRVVDQVRQTDAEVMVCYTPDGAQASMESWLGSEGITYRPQGDGDLGQRMDRMLTEVLVEVERVVVIGTDAPFVDQDVVTRALGALDHADVVLGPALDGGYYLIGMTRPHPELFEDMTWSTDSVLADTLVRAERLGLRVTQLEPHRDIDTIEDLTPEVRALLSK